MKAYGKNLYFIGANIRFFIFIWSFNNFCQFFYHPKLISRWNLAFRKRIFLSDRQYSGQMKVNSWHFWLNFLNFLNSASFSQRFLIIFENFAIIRVYFLKVHFLWTRIINRDRESRSNSNPEPEPMLWYRGGRECRVGSGAGTDEPHFKLKNYESRDSLRYFSPGTQTKI